MKKLFALLLACALLAMGCVGEPEKSTDWTPETGVTPSPSTEALNATPSPAVSPTPSIAPSSSPSPAPSLLPSPSLSPVPSPTAAPACSLTLQSIGDAQKRVIAEFTGTNASTVYMRCKATDGWTQQTLNAQKLASIDCIYAQNATAFTYAAGAMLGDAECAVNVYVPVSTASYLFTVAPATDAFTIYKNVSNTTIRYYYVNNTGTAALAAFNCTASDYALARQTACPTSYEIGGGSNTSFTYNVSSFAEGVHYVVLNYGATDATNATISVVITVYNGAAPTPTPSPSPSPSPSPTPTPAPACTTVSAAPSTINTSAGPNTTAITTNYFNFTGTLSPTANCGFGSPVTGSCGSAPDGSCTITCDYTGQTAGPYSVSTSINGTACGGSLTVTVQS